MIAILLFPLFAAFAVWLAGRHDTARDPRLTTLALALLAVFPLLLLLPKIPLLPASDSPAVAPSHSILPSWLLPSLWLGGFLVAVTRLGLSALGLSRWRRRSTPLGQAAPGVELRLLRGLHGPVAAGVLRPVVFVPETWTSLDEATRHTILLHELAHHRHRDPLLRWLAAFTAAVHWFNPLVHWMTRRLALQCEHACDRHVVAAGIRADHYAELLCRFATARALPVAGLAMAETSSLENRVRHLMTPRHNRGFFTLFSLAAVTVWSAALLALAGHRPAPANLPDAAEVELRLTANPFPAD